MYIHYQIGKNKQHHQPGRICITILAEQAIYIERDKSAYLTNWGNTYIQIQTMLGSPWNSNLESQLGRSRSVHPSNR